MFKNGIKFLDNEIFEYCNGCMHRHLSLGLQFVYCTAIFAITYIYIYICNDAHYKRNQFGKHRQGLPLCIFLVHSEISKTVLICFNCLFNLGWDLFFSRYPHRKPKKPWIQDRVTPPPPVVRSATGRGS